MNSIAKQGAVETTEITLEEARNLSEKDYLSSEYSINFTGWLNNTTSIQRTESTLAPNYVALLIIPIIIVVAMGNVLVIVAVSLDKKLRSATNCFLTSLAFADLLVALTVMPPSLAMIVNNYVWPLNIEFCGVWVMLDVLFSTSSILHLCMISLDRYIALARPLRCSNSFAGGGRFGEGRARGFQFSFPTESKKVKRVASRIFAVWTIALGLSIPLLILGKIDGSYIFVDGMCVINIAEFQIIGSFAAFFLPLIIMFIMYVLTIRTLKKQARMVSSMLAHNCKHTSRHSHRKSSRKQQGNNQSSTTFNRDCSNCVYTARQYQRSESTVATEESAADNYDSVQLLERQLSKKSQSSELSQEKLAEHNRSWKIIAARPIAKVLDQVHTITRIGAFQIRSKNSTTNLTEIVDYQHCSCKREEQGNKNTGKENKKMETGYSSDQKSNPFSRKSRSSARRMSSSFKTRAMASITNEQRASKVLGLIFVLFCLFWCPFFITNVVSRLCLSCDQALMGEFMNWFVWVGYVSSGVNPIVYTMFSRRFRGTFFLLLKGKFSEINQHKFTRSFSNHETSGASVRSTTGSAFRASSKTCFYAASSHPAVKAKTTSSSENSEQEEEWIRNVRSAKTMKFTPRRYPSEPHKRRSNEIERKQIWRSSWHSNHNDNNSVTNNSGKLSKSISTKEVGKHVSRTYSENDVNCMKDLQEHSFKFQSAIDEAGETDQRRSLSSGKTWSGEDEDYSSEDMTSSNDSIWSNNSRHRLTPSEVGEEKTIAPSQSLTNNNNTKRYTMTLSISQKSENDACLANQLVTNVTNSETNPH